MLSTTVNNATVGEIVTMFIGVAIVAGLVAFFLKSHRRI